MEHTRSKSLEDTKRLKVFMQIVEDEVVQALTQDEVHKDSSLNTCHKHAGEKVKSRPNKLR